MDEAYASPDSDGHASLPSPTDTTFDLSLLPVKRRGRQQDPNIVSSFVNAPTEDDSSDDDEGDETFLRNSLSGAKMRMLPTSPGLISSALSSAAKPRSNVLAPTSAKNNSNAPRSTPRQAPRGPRPATQGTDSSRENINPKGSFRRPSPPRLMLHRPENGSSDEGEDVAVDTTVPLASIAAGEFPYTGAVVNESLIKAPEPRSADVSTTPFGDAYERSLDSLTLKQAPNTPTKKLPPTLESPRSIPKLRKSRKSISPKKTTPQPMPVDNKPNLTPEIPRLRYLNWLNSDSVDEGLTESANIPAGHSARLRKAQAQRIIDETAFLGGDEASFIEKEVVVGNEGMKEEMLDMFHRGSGPMGGVEENFFDEEVDPNESRLTVMSEENIPMAPLRQMLSGSTNVPESSEGGTVKRSSEVVTYDGAGDDKTERSASPAGSLKRETKQPAPEPQNDGEKPKDEDEEASTVNHPNIDESASQYQTPESMAGKPSSSNFAPAPSGIMVEDLSSAFLDETRVPVDRAQALEFSVKDPTMLQFFSNASNSPDRATESVPPAANPLIQSSFSDKTARPSVTQRQKVEKPTSSTLADGNTQNSFSDVFLAQSTPKQHYNPYSLRELKNSNRARRVSMNTPPSSLERSLSGNELLNDPPDFSSLGSGFSFPSIPVRYKDWDPDSVAREFTPPFPVEGSRAQGYNPPQNTPTPAAGKARGLWELEGILEGKGRVRSKSDPVENKSWEAGKRLFTPKRLGRTEEKHEDAANKSVFSEDSEEDVGRGVELDDEGDLDDDPELELSESENERGGRHWSGFTQDFRENFSGADREASRIAEVAEPFVGPSSTLNMGNVEFRSHTPASIGESKDVTNDLIDRSNKTLWLRMAQAEAENDRFRKLLESNNINIESSSQDFTLSGSNPNVNLQDSRDMSTRSIDFNVSTSEDIGSLRRRVMELEGLLEILGRKEVELRAENERKDNLVMHWRNQYNDVQKLAVQNRQLAMGLENHVKNLEQQAAVDSVNHDREINKVVSKLHTEKQDVIKHSRQKSIGLEDRLKFLEQRVHEAQEAHRRDVEEKKRTIAYLRQALDRRGSIGNGDESIAEMHEKLYEQQQAHEADTAKFTNLLEEKEGLVRHLQAELDEMVNLMPVDHGSSRMIDGGEAEDWLDERSREISQYYDDGLDQIITELHGVGEREDFEEAVEEAEMSLRRVAEEAGLDEPLDKATLAAFGIRQLRTEYTMIKRFLIESEGRVKDLIQVNDEFARCGDQTEKLRVSEEQRIAFQTVAKEAEAAGKVLADQVDALRAKLIDAEQHIRYLEAENEALEAKLADAGEKTAVLETDKEALQMLVNDTKRLNDMLKSQSAEVEKRNQGFEEEIGGLRRQLAEEKEHVSVVETETITLRQQITEWEDTAVVVGKEKEGIQMQLKDAQDKFKVLEKEKDTLKKQLDEVAKAQVASKETDTLKRTVKELQERLKHLTEQHFISAATATQLEGKLKHADQATQRLAAEKAFLKAELEITVNETKAARGRFAQLLHDTAEKEAKWMSVRSELSHQASTNSREDSSETVAAYKKSLAVIVAEIGKDTLPVNVSYAGNIEEGEEFDTEGMQDPELVKVVIRAFRLRGKVIVDAEEKCKRYRGAARKWKENEKRKAELVVELELKLKAEKKSSDEKMSQMILALRGESS